MPSLTRIDRLLVAGLTAVAAALPLAQAAQAGTAEPPDGLPTKIQVEDGHKVFSVQHATGVQIYRCNATATGYSWGLVAPRANLFDDKGKLTMTHFAGPTWQAQDGSQVKGARVDGVNQDATAIDWLLLRKASASAGPDGDQLTNTSFIQRINTTGGVAPAAAECNALTLNTTSEIDYTADYYFWKPTGA